MTWASVQALGEVVEERDRARAERDQARAEVERLRETNQRLNRRCQVYERGLAEKLEAAKRVGVSLGRGLATAAHAMASAELERVRAERDRLAAQLVEARMDADSLGSVISDFSTVYQAAFDLTKALADAGGADHVEIPIVLRIPIERLQRTVAKVHEKADHTRKVLMNAVEKSKAGHAD